MDSFSEAVKWFVQECLHLVVSVLNLFTAMAILNIFLESVQWLYDWLDNLTI